MAFTHLMRGAPVSLGAGALFALSLMGAGGAFAAQPTSTAQEPVTLELSLRDRVLNHARRYAEFEWTASQENALHGEDPRGTHVDTPDETFDPDGWRLDGSSNIGMPYAWGGFSSIEDFERGLREGRLAGHVPSSEHMTASSYSVGLDCSGLVSRCWELPLKQSTRSLGSLCTELESYDDLLPGDIINKFDSHVVLFMGYVDPERQRMRVIEAARLRVKESEYGTELLRKSGFVPMRYAPLQETWVPMDSLVARGSWTMEPFEGTGTVTFEEQEARQAWLARAENQARAKAGDWVRYRFKDSSRQPQERLITKLVSNATESTLTIQTSEETSGGSLMRVSELSTAADPLAQWFQFACPGEPYEHVVLETLEVEEGQSRAADAGESTQRIRGKLVADLLMRHAHYPTTIDFEFVLDSTLPLFRILEARVLIATDYAREGAEAPMVHRSLREWELVEWGAGD